MLTHAFQSWKILHYILFNIRAIDKCFLSRKLRHTMAEFCAFLEIQDMQMHCKRQRDKTLKTNMHGLRKMCKVPCYLLQTHFVNIAKEKRLCHELMSLKAPEVPKTIMQNSTDTHSKIKYNYIQNYQPFKRLNH